MEMFKKRRKTVPLFSEKSLKYYRQVFVQTVVKRQTYLKYGSRGNSFQECGLHIFFSLRWCFIADRYSFKECVQRIFNCSTSHHSTADLLQSCEATFLNEKHETSMNIFFTHEHDYREFHTPSSKQIK